MQQNQGLSVSHTVRQKVLVNRGRISVSLSHQSFQLGPEAEQQQAVVDFKKQLTALGVSNDNIELKGASNKVIKGFFSQSEDNQLYFEVVFELSQFQALCRRLDSIQNCTITGLTWLCDNQTEIEDALIERGLLEIKGRAQKHAKLLSMRVAGLSYLNHTVTLHNNAPRGGDGYSGSMSKMKMAKPSLSGYWNSSMTIEVKLNAAFQVASSHSDD